MEIVGFGETGKKIAKNFEKWPQYNIHYIGFNTEGEICYNFPFCETVESAEQNTPKFTELIKKIKSEIIFICTGDENISGSILATLEQLREKDTTVVYVRSDLDFLSEKKKIQEKVISSILQNYTRSGLLKRMFLIDKVEVAKILGDLSIKDYHKRINQLIANSLHMLNYFKNSESILGNISSTSEINRLSTVGIYDINEEIEKYFFNFENPREKHFYFALNEETINEEKNLLNKIKEQVKKAGQPSFTAVSYDITATTYEENFAYIEAHTNFIQGEKVVDKDSE